MPRLFWIGSPFFSQALSACGWEVVVHNFEHEAVYTWNDVVQLAGGEPDVVVVADKSRPPFVLGQEHFPCLTVLYAVDTHIHSWLPWYAQSFDLCLVSLRDHCPNFLGHRLQPEQVVWSPPYAPTQAQPPASLQPHAWPCLFVGTVDSVRTPQRKRFLEALTPLLPGLHVTAGAYAPLYAQADVVLNVSELGDMNFRIFEALGCGACLVTPHVEHGLTKLFVDGQDLLTYPELDAPAAAQAVRTLLADPARRVSMAFAGMQCVNAGHRDIHRAQALTAILAALPADMPRDRCAQAAYIHQHWLRPLYLLLADAMPGDVLRTAYLKAAKPEKIRI